MVYFNCCVRWLNKNEMPRVGVRFAWQETWKNEAVRWLCSFVFRNPLCQLMDWSCSAKMSATNLLLVLRPGWLPSGRLLKAIRLQFPLTANQINWTNFPPKSSTILFVLDYTFINQSAFEWSTNLLSSVGRRAQELGRKVAEIGRVSQRHLSTPTSV